MLSKAHQLPRGLQLQLHLHQCRALSRWSSLPNKVSSSVCLPGWRTGMAPAAASVPTAPFSSRSSQEQHEKRRFWQDLYQKEEDVFTLPEPNDNLRHFLTQMLPQLIRKPGSDSREEDEQYLPSVFVPLCGRSNDLVFLSEKNCVVVGLDYAPSALLAWSKANGGVQPGAETGDMAAYVSRLYPNVSLVHADIFKVRPGHFGGNLFDAVWDRAALTSIDEPQRRSYAAVLGGLLKPGGRLLLEFLSCNLPLEGSMGTEDAVSLLRGVGFEVQLLKEEDVREAYPDFTPDGLTHLNEVVLLATKKGEAGGAAAGGAGAGAGADKR